MIVPFSLFRLSPRNPANTRSNDTYAYTGLANANVSSTVNGLNQVTAAGGGTVYHDERGNVIGVPAAASATGAAAGYDYMAENRLVHGPGGSAFFHDPLGRMYASYAPALGATYYLMAGETIVAEIDSGYNVMRRYVPGPVREKGDSHSDCPLFPSLYRRGRQGHGI